MNNSDQVLARFRREEVHSLKIEVQLDGCVVRRGVAGVRTRATNAHRDQP